MKWLTAKEIRAAAEESPEAALACSVQHWEQLATATEEELREALDKDIVGLGRCDCALCVRYWPDGEDTCFDTCLLRRAGQCCSRNGSLYVVARATKTDWFFLARGEDWSAWQAAARAMYEFLKGLQEGQ